MSVGSLASRGAVAISVHVWGVGEGHEGQYSSRYGARGPAGLAGFLNAAVS